MKTSIIITLSIIIFAAGCTSHSPDATEPTLSLFNGQNLDGWVIESQGDFSVQDGRLVVNRGTGWLRSQESFGDFVLEMEFRFLEKEANSGIFVRTGPTSKNDDSGWPDNGYQVQCKDTITEDRALATMIPYGAPPFEHESDRDALARAYRPTGQWNHYEITCQGETLQVKLNGVLITTATGIKNRQGHIGIQAEHGLLEFRKVDIILLETQSTEHPHTDRRQKAAARGSGNRGTSDEVLPGLATA